jgi:hypothetical protein
LQRPLLALHHVCVKIRRTPHGLAGVVDNKIQPRVLRLHVAAKRLHAGSVAQIQSEHLQPMSPLLEIRFRCVTHRRIAWEARRDDELGAAAEQFDASLIADFHAAARQQGRAPAQVGQFAALAPVQFRAGRAKLVVEVMDLGIIPLADVTILRFNGLVEVRVILHRHWLEVRWRKDVRRGEDFLPAQLADARLVELGISLLLFRGLALFDLGLHQPAALADIGAIQVPGGFHQARVFRLGQSGEQLPVPRGLFQQFNRRPEWLGGRRGFGRIGPRAPFGGAGLRAAERRSSMM